MHHRFFSVVILVAASVFVSGEARRAIPDPTPTDPAGLVVHEWGTFTSVASGDGSAAEWVPQLGPSELPCFVDRAAFNIKGWLPATVRMETPVLYFYSPIKRTVDVRVKFPRGAITEWYPRAAVSPAAIELATLKNPRLEGAIEWKRVEITPQAEETFPVLDLPNHYYAARKTSASPIAVGDQREKFLFYRGVGNFDVPVVATLTNDGRTVVTSSSTRPLGDVMLFDNTRGTITFSAMRSARTTETLTVPSTPSGMDAVRQALEATLVARGLYQPEAAAMIETWRDSWFEEGRRVFYIIDQRTVDGILPLDITPEPASVARVFVGRIEMLTPAILGEVKDALRRRDREPVLKYGRFLRPIIARLAATNLATPPDWNQQMTFAYSTVTPAIGACQ